MIEGGQDSRERPGGEMLTLAETLARFNIGAHEVYDETFLTPGTPDTETNQYLQALAGVGVLAQERGWGTN